jgi:ribonuclease HI
MVAIDWAIAKKRKTLYLHYDYTGIENWAKGNWKTNRDGTRDYKRYYDSIKDKLEVRFIKVKAHSGNDLNDEADQLAKDAIL